MKIVFITPGSGDNFYCENCMRDRALIRALGRIGLDVIFMPLYLPVELERPEQHVSVSPIFFGGINVYLEQKSGLFRHTPRWINKLFDSRFMLNLAARKAGMTDPSGLGDLTLSMLEGKNGKQKRELDMLLEWLAQPAHKPDIICLSNALLNGIAPAVKQQLGIPVVCLLQDEDGFVDSLGSWSEPVWHQMQANSQSIDRYIAVSQFYADLMQKRLKLKDTQVDFCYSGVELSDYENSDTRPTDSRPAIGFLSRICPIKGFDSLIRAFTTLKQEPDLVDLQLVVSGGQIGDDTFLEEQKQYLARHNMLTDVLFMNDFVHQSDRLKFFNTVDIVCVPEQAPVAHGRYAIEAFASGRPVVAPDWGVFPEIISLSQAGLLYRHDNETDLIAKLKLILTDHEQQKQLAENALNKAKPLFDIDRNAQTITEIFEQTI